MKQQSFSDIEYSMRKKTTKREEFLNIMEEIIPWDEWVEYMYSVVTQFTDCTSTWFTTHDRIEAKRKEFRVCLGKREVKPC